ncbi:AfsR/SARP family transcriptional regulator [Streptomyces griseocarneus]|uniref:AfsR/SARP family transcriptional regulator n=1 Tax=Streptomyces griseocarneus TaxID=51201 RepID=UPI00167CBF2D|nr:AfsR/SARP family transcriptional regulator [Streptomyces griseocarneus]MBZ6473126.1 AfsR/SARP family transcriptional regulator [Streptomyces griseocarneus]GHG60003.1 regulatory protein AfsR [Streptomyces griseocarneus]
MSGDEETQRLRFHVLGPVRADMDGRPLPLGSPEQRAVLAILLLRGGRPLTTDELIEALWGDSPPARAVDTLHDYLARLRATLEPERTPGTPLLVSEGGGHAARVDPEAVDAAVFHRHREAAEAARAAGDLAGAYAHLGAALALWEGTALSALPGPYAERERARLADLRVTAQEDLFACAFALGRDAGAIAALRTLAAEHPLRERTRALLMHALHRAGRQAEALAVFTEARRALERERGRGPGPELTRMHEQVLARDPALTTPAAPPPATAPEAPAGPDPLPWNDATDADRAPHLAGREELAARVRTALTGPAGRPAPVVVLTGPGGAGKTDLALHAAHALRTTHPDGLITLDLRGSGPEPLETEAALDRLLHALGVTDGALPEGTARRTALYRSLLAERRALLLLDDAAGTGQVLPLLPGAPGCAVLVTTRAPDLEVPGAGRVEVTVPEEKEALAMLAALAGDTAGGAAEAARAVVAACGTLPLALRVAAARLTTRPFFTPADLAARLRDERTRLEELHTGDAHPGDLATEAAFRVAYDCLEAEPARAFRLLALADVPAVDAASAAAVLELPDAADAEPLLAALALAGLLHPPGPGRHRHPGPLRDFARRQSERTDSPPVRDAALLRLLDHHLATAVTALLRVRPDSPVPRHLRHHLVTTGRPLPDAHTARAWLHDAHPHLLALTGQVLDLDIPDALRPAADLLTVWDRLTTGTARQRDLEAPARRALERARQWEDDASAARALRVLAAPRFGPDTYERAERDLRACLRLAEAADDPLALTLTSGELGVVLLSLGRPGDALPLLVQAEEHLRAEGAMTSALEARAHAGRAYIGLGRAEEALAAANEATEEAREEEHAAVLPAVLHLAGRTLLAADRAATATDRLREALGLETDPRRTALLWAHLAHCRLDQRQHREAVTAADRALEAEAGLGDAYCRGLALAARGRALPALGEPRIALGCLREAYDVLERRGAAEAADVRALLDEEFPDWRVTGGG